MSPDYFFCRNSNQSFIRWSSSEELVTKFISHADESPDQARLKAPLQQGFIATSPPSAEAECGSTLDSEVTTSDSSVKQEVEKESAPLQGNARREALPIPKYNVVQLLENGKTMRWVGIREGLLRAVLSCGSTPS